MGITEIKSQQIKDGNIYREDLNINTSGKAVVRKILSSTGIQLQQTGVDPGTGDVTISLSPIAIDTTLVLNIDGTSGNIVTGNKGYFRIPYGCVPVEWYLMADQVGSIEIEMLHGTTFPPINNVGAIFSIINNNYAQGDPTSWEISSFNAQDFVGFNVNSVSNIRRINLVLILRRNII